MSGRSRVNGGALNLCGFQDSGGGWWYGEDWGVGLLLVRLCDTCHPFNTTFCCKNKITSRVDVNLGATKESMASLNYDTSTT